MILLRERMGILFSQIFGTVTESGRGRLEHDIYIDGYYIQEENRRRKDIEKKKQEFIKLLNISEERAEQILEDRRGGVF